MRLDDLVACRLAGFDSRIEEQATLLIGPLSLSAKRDRLEMAGAQAHTDSIRVRTDAAALDLRSGGTSEGRVSQQTG